VQKLGEAQAMVAGGVQDVFISNEIVHPAKVAGVAGIARAHAAMPAEHRATPAEPKLTICCDCPEGVHLLAAALDAEAAKEETDKPGRGGMIPVGVFVELEVGQGRCGAVPAGPRALATVEAVLEYAKKAASPRLYYAGIHAYNGATQHVRTFDARKAEIDTVVAGAAAMRDAVKMKLRTDTPLITGAGTGTFPLEAESGIFGELQPGSYLVMDRDYADNEADERHPSFEHALFVASRVMSFGSTPGAVVVDAGHKSHAIDSGMPTVLGRPDVEVLNRGDEHAIVAPRAADGDCGLGLNDLVHLIPGHCDPTFNLHDEAVGIRGGMKDGKVERIIAIDARGCGY
jgi:D-serine deaminase-like pyridoxal phosphate-dependent protein